MVPLNFQCILLVYHLCPISGTHDWWCIAVSMICILKKHWKTYVSINYDHTEVIHDMILHWNKTSVFFGDAVGRTALMRIYVIITCTTSVNLCMSTVPSARSTIYLWTNHIATINPAVPSLNWWATLISDEPWPVIYDCGISPTQTDRAVVKGQWFGISFWAIVSCFMTWMLMDGIL